MTTTEANKKFKVVRIFMFEKEVEASYNTLEEAEKHVEDAKMQEEKIGGAMRSKFMIEVTNPNEKLKK